MLLVLQGMDTSGKGGTVKHVVGQVDPAGVRVARSASRRRRSSSTTSSGASASSSRAPGKLGVFDRSHYEDVVAVRVHELVDARHLAAPLRRRSTASRSELADERHW